jgi:hypothetical protein
MPCRYTRIICSTATDTADMSNPLYTVRTNSLISDAIQIEQLNIRRLSVIDNKTKEKRLA